MKHLFLTCLSHGTVITGNDQSKSRRYWQDDTWGKQPAIKGKIKLSLVEAVLSAIAIPDDEDGDSSIIAFPYREELIKILVY